MSSEWRVYWLLCADQTFYIGATNNLTKRIAIHNKGRGAKYTKARLPVFLLFSLFCSNKSEALKLEYRLKQLTRKQKESYLMKNIDIETLKLMICGKEEQVGKEELQKLGYTTRVTSRDGKPYIHTRDLKAGRINLDIVDGKIIGLTIG